MAMTGALDDGEQLDVVEFPGAQRLVGPR